MEKNNMIINSNNSLLSNCTDAFSQNLLHVLRQGIKIINQNDIDVVDTLYVLIYSKASDKNSILSTLNKFSTEYLRSILSAISNITVSASEASDQELQEFLINSISGILSTREETTHCEDQLR